jgi:hypothetical protein
MPRIAVGGLNHETNSFAPQPATFERFEEADGWPPLSRGDAVLANTAGLNLAIAGFAAAAAPRHELVPLTWANACPSGPVTRDAFERLAGMLVDDLARAMPVDGLFLDLHGAMVAEHLEDGEGELLRRLREAPPGCRSSAPSTCTRTCRTRWWPTPTRSSPSAPTRTSTSPPPAPAACRCSSACWPVVRWRRLSGRSTS